MHPASAPNAAVRPTINSIFDFSAEALGQLKTWLEQNPPSIPITQIIGFSQFTAAPATTVVAQESRTLAGYANLATTGPQITLLPNGSYIVFFGAMVTNNAGGAASMSLSVNGSSPANSDRAYSDVAGSNISVMRAVPVTLSSGSNTVLAQYSGNGAAASFWQLRWMIALKYANS